MKIEKINDRQIRCILTKEDLEDRKIRLSELVYGGEKARGLFRDMLLRASSELGFEFQNNPLMIEAVPTQKDQLVLIITRVDDPEELDTRFSRFSAEGGSGKDSTYASLSDSLSGADDILNMLRRISKARGKGDTSGDKGSGDEPAKTRPEKENSSEKQEPSYDFESFLKEVTKPEGKNEPMQGSSGAQGPKKSVSVPAHGTDKKGTAAMRPLTEEEIYQFTRFYMFRNLENVLSAASRIDEDYQGQNSLYKNPDDGAFYLLVRKMETGAEQFNRICNVLSEYAMPMDYATGMDEFFREHMQVIVADQALQRLRNV